MVKYKVLEHYHSSSNGIDLLNYMTQEILKPEFKSMIENYLYHF
jgi:hypothetical protein